MRRPFIWVIILIVAGTVLICSLAPADKEQDQAPETIGFSDSSNKPMSDFIERFNVLLSGEPAQKLLPVTEIPTEELSWLFKDDNGIDSSELKGLLFANGDMLIIFYTKSDNNVRQNIIDNVMENPDFKGKDKVISVEGEIGYIIGSKDYSENIKEMIKTAKRS